MTRRGGAGPRAGRRDPARRAAVEETSGAGRAAGAAVEVVYALPDEQRVVTVQLAEGLTAGGAVRRSGLLEAFPEIADRPLVLGLFGEPIGEDRQLAPGDRVEISRPLVRDPRDLRREMLAQGRVMGTAGRRGRGTADSGG